MDEICEKCGETEASELVPESIESCYVHCYDCWQGVVDEALSLW